MTQQELLNHLASIDGKVFNLEEFTEMQLFPNEAHLNKIIKQANKLISISMLIQGLYKTYKELDELLAFDWYLHTDSGLVSLTQSEENKTFLLTLPHFYSDIDKYTPLSIGKTTWRDDYENIEGDIDIILDILLKYAKGKIKKVLEFKEWIKNS